MSTRTHLWILPALALALAPAFAAQQSGPKVQGPGVKSVTGDCYSPPLSKAVSYTLMSALPPPGLCTGTVYKPYAVAYCATCKRPGDTFVFGGCAPPCRTGYQRANKNFAKCCRYPGAGYSQPPPPPAIK
jgi:hypothetical protein